MAGYGRSCVGLSRRSLYEDGSLWRRRANPPVYHSRDQAVISRIGIARSTRAIRLGVFNAAQISFLRCTFSQKSGVFPNTFASIKAVSTVTDRLLVQISLTVRRLTPMASASCTCEHVAAP